MADTMGVVQSAEFIPEVVANKALGLLDAELHLSRNVARNYDFSPQKQGDKLLIPKRGSLSANAKVSGTGVTLQNPTADKVSVTLDQHYEVTFALEDIVKTVKGVIKIDEGYIADAMVTLGEEVETALATLVSSLTTNSRGAAATDLTDAVLRATRGDLSKNRAPKSNRFLYVEPDQVNVILGLDKFTSSEKYGSATPVQEGELGRIYGMKGFESLFTQSGGSPTEIYNVAFHRDAFVLATRPLAKPTAPGVQCGYVERNGIVFRVLISYNADQLADQITIDTLFGVAILRDELAVKLLS